MKNLSCITLLAIIVFLILPVGLLAQGTTIPITTSSDEAREAFIVGRQKKENIQTDAARLLFNRAIELDPEFALAYVYRGDPGDFDKAMELIDKVSDGEKLTILYFIANETFEYKDAKDYLDQLLQKYPSYKHIHLWAGLFYENILHNYQLALDHFYIASRLDEYYAAPHNEIGYRLMRLGNFKEAELSFKRYIALAPDCPNAYDSYANFLMKMKRFDESIQQYNKVYDLDPDKIITIARIGQNYAFRGEFDEARSYYSKFSDMAYNTGQKAIALLLMSGSYIAEGKVKKAIDEMQNFINLGEETGTNLYLITGTSYIGLINLTMGNVKKGLADCQRAEELFDEVDLPEPTRKRYSFSSLGWLSRAYAINNDFDKADEYLERARIVVEETDNPLYRSEYHFYVGFVELKKGNSERAIENLLMCDIDDPFNIYTLALAYSLVDESGRAQEYLDLLDSWENYTLMYAISLILSKDIVLEE